MCGSNDPRRLLRVLNLRESHLELDGKLETTLLAGKQAHPTVDRDVAYLDELGTTHHAQSSLETGRVAHSQQLFRVRAALSPPISFGERSCTSRAPSFVRR